MTSRNTINVRFALTLSRLRFTLAGEGYCYTTRRLNLHITFRWVFHPSSHCFNCCPFNRNSTLYWKKFMRRNLHFSEDIFNFRWSPFGITEGYSVFFLVFFSLSSFFFFLPFFSSFFFYFHLLSFFIVIGSQIALVPKTSRDSSASISIHQLKNKLIN